MTMEPRSDRSFERGPDHSAPSGGHETSDVRLRNVGWIVFALLVLVALGNYLPLGLFDWFEYRADREQPELPPLAATKEATPPPRLQSSPARDLQTFRQKEQQQLDSYSWVDKQQGIVRIPIARAMELIAERGLPETAQPSSRVDESGRSESASPPPNEPPNRTSFPSAIPKAEGDRR